MTNQGQVVAEVIAVGDGVGPGVVLIDQVSLPVAFLDDVEVQSDRRTVDEAGPRVRRRDQSSAVIGASVLVLGAAAEEPVPRQMKEGAMNGGLGGASH